MENQNISYRRLRQAKRAKTCKTPTSLLAKKQMHGKGQNKGDKKKQFSIMTQNVTRYQHMLRHPHIKQNYINWIVKLREPIELKNKSGEDAQFIPSVPAVYNKTTQSRQNFLKDQNSTSGRYFNSADFYQVISRKECQKHLEQNTLGYMTSLRQQKISGSPLKPKFCNLPSKDRKQFPQFLTKDAIKAMKNIKKQQKQSAFDGAQNYPAYSQKICPQKNYGLLRTFIQYSNKTSLPTLSWQMGLRN